MTEAIYDGAVKELAVRSHTFIPLVTRRRG